MYTFIALAYFYRLILLFLFRFCTYIYSLYSRVAPYINFVYLTITTIFNLILYHIMVTIADSQEFKRVICVSNYPGLDCVRVNVGLDFHTNGTFDIIINNIGTKTYMRRTFNVTFENLLDYKYIDNQGFVFKFLTE